MLSRSGPVYDRLADQSRLKTEKRYYQRSSMRIIFWQPGDVTAAVAGKREEHDRVGSSMRMIF